MAHENSLDALRFGIVGLGRSGWDIHAAELRHRDDVQIRAVADPEPGRRAEAVEGLGCEAYKTIGPLLRREDIDVVVVATPSVCHGPDSKRVLKAGKHVVVEKPMALNLREADSVIRTAREYGRHLFIHQNYRFFKPHVHLAQVLESGILGPVWHIRNYSSKFTRRNDWQTLAKNGGGVLNNTCSHNIDSLLQFVGSPVKTVMGDLRQIASAGDVEDHVKVFLRAENGVTVDLEVSTAQNVVEGLPAWIICGRYGTLTSDGRRSVIRWFDPGDAPDLHVVEGAAPGRRYGNPEAIPWQEKVIDIEADTKVPQTFYDNVCGVLRGEQTMQITPESVREVIRVIEVVRKGAGFPGRLSRSRAPA